MLGGCLQVSTVIRVEPDGSGTIQQTLLFNPRNVEGALASLGLEGTQGGTAPRAGSASTPISEADLREAAKVLGDGVRLISISPMSEPDGFQGLRAKFAFTDVTRLHTDDLLLPSSIAADVPGTPAGFVRIELRRTAGGTSLLTVHLDETPRRESKVGPDPDKPRKVLAGFDDEEGRKMAAALFRGFRIGLDIEVGGRIVAAKADHQTGSRITLFEMDLGQLAATPARLDALGSVMRDDAPLAKLRPHVQDRKGLKINRPVVTVEFR
jgi:hypothetical protein